mgnify:CR=1 FL=1
MPTIPDSVVDMSFAFQECSSLNHITKIPTGVTYMRATFQGCTSLTTPPEIPESVVNIVSIFRDCINLQGELIINANVQGLIITDEWGSNMYDYGRCLENATTAGGITLKVSGECSILDKIVSTANNSSVTL